MTKVGKVLLIVGGVGVGFFVVGSVLFYIAKKHINETLNRMNKRLDGHK